MLTSHTFDRDMVQALPETARRYLRHTISEDVPLRSLALLKTHGVLKVGRWRPFSALWQLSPTGFRWAARTRFGPLPISGCDELSDGQGRMQWSVLGTLPLIRASGRDVTRSAAGRLASESVFNPASLLEPGVTWKAIDDDAVVAVVPIGGATHEIRLHVGASGRLLDLRLRRWGNPSGHFKEETFGAIFDDEITFQGVTIPRTARAGWRPELWGADQGEFIRFTVDSATFN